MSAAHQQIGSWLGITSAITEAEVLQLVERRLPTSAINRLLALGLTRTEIDATVIPSVPCSTAVPVARSSPSRSLTESCESSVYSR